MIKKILTAILIVSSVTLIGCVSKEDNFETRVAKKFSLVDSSLSELNVQITDMQSEIQMLRRELGISNEAAFSSEDINFASIKVLTKDGSIKDGEITLLANSTFNLNLDVLNTTENNLSQLIAQAYLTYEKDGKFDDRYLLDTRFDILPKSVRQKIEFKDIPLKDANYVHTLTVILKDTRGNAITSFKKNINIKK